MNVRLFSCRFPGWASLVLLSILVPLVPLVSAGVFEDDFESYPVGGTAVWDDGSGAPVVNESSMALFGAPNQSVDLTDPARKLLTDVGDIAIGGVTTLSLDSAELARNLGRLDLYEATFDGQTTPRLAVILEYFANLMLGNTQHPCGGSWAYDYLGQYNRFDNYEVAYNHYINRVKANCLPVFAEMVEDFWRHDVGEDAHFLLWSRLTHGDNAYAPVPPPDHYGAWVAEEFTAHGITDPAATARSADYNGDGISNALHHWTLTDPRAVSGEPVLNAVSAEVPGGFRVRFVERPDAAAYGREFRFSADLVGDPAAWGTIAPDPITIIEDRGAQVVREAVFTIDGPQGFVVIAYPSTR